MSGKSKSKIEKNSGKRPFKKHPLKKINPALKSFGGISAKVVRLARTFGFVRRLDDETDMFVSGRNLLGAMVGDEVLVKLQPQQGEKPEGKVIEITKEAPITFSGVIIDADDGGKLIQPDNIAPFPMAIEKDGLGGAKTGDKVLAEISKRGTNHSAHRANIIRILGDSNRASICALALAETSGVTPNFSNQVKDEARLLQKRGITDTDLIGRLDLRGELIFTIDGADSKDLDDAISISRNQRGYKVGVHIADVSHYVTKGSEIDAEAFERGTSVYFADRVAPMLPPELSNGICSLNPGEDRLAISAIMNVDNDGIMLDYCFTKSVVRTCVRGVYSEVNALLMDEGSDELQAKYAPVLDSLKIANELADILAKNKLNRGAPVFGENESKLIMNEEGVCIGVEPRQRGKSEMIIEELMILANQAAATLARDEELPFVYRVHEQPDIQKLEALREALTRFNIPSQGLKEKAKPKHLARILESARATPYYPIISRLVLRSMAKAQYSHIPLGHYGLVLADYCHFTSPIRRYPDLAIHRIISEYLSGTQRSTISRKYKMFVISASKKSSEMELLAMRLERSCVDIYLAEFMTGHINEDFDGLISGIADHGIYVEILGCVEGLLRTNALPSGTYTNDGGFEYVETVTGVRYRIGEPIKVRCVGANVAAGQIDFVLTSN